MMRALILPLLLLLLGLLTAPALAQTVTTTAPLPDGDRDGRVRVVAQAAALGVPRGTILTLCPATTWTYRYGSGECTVALDVPGKIGPVPLASSGRVVTRAWQVVETWPKTDYTGQVNAGLVATEIGRVGIRLKGRVDGVTIRDFRLEHSAVENVSPHLPVAIAVENGRDILIQDGRASGFQMTYVAGKYRNGDVYSTERLVDRITFRRVAARNASDGCFDLKSTNTILDQTTGGKCGIIYRLWGSGFATTIVSEDPRKYHVAFYTGADWHIGHLTARAATTAPILFFEGLTTGARVVIDGCTIAVPRGTRLFLGKPPKTLILGPGCAVP
jgi:hypothetical protein